jgi:hypothetical protein
MEEWEKMQSENFCCTCSAKLHVLGVHYDIYKGSYNVIVYFALPPFSFIPLLPFLE